MARNKKNSNKQLNPLTKRIRKIRQTKPKVSRRKKIIKIRKEINKIEIKKNIEKITKTKN